MKDCPTFASNVVFLDMIRNTVRCHQVTQETLSNMGTGYGQMVQLNSVWKNQKSPSMVDLREERKIVQKIDTL